MSRPSWCATPPGASERITTSVCAGRSGSCYLIVDEQQPIAGYEPAVLLRHAARHQRADHDESVRRPQRILEGTGVAGESLPEPSSGCPTYSGRGEVLLPKEILPEKPKKTLTQQLFHPGLFTRQRSASLSDANDKTQRNNNNTTIVENEQNRLYNPSAPWQRVPNQKRNRSPDESITNQAKRTQRREKIINKHRGIDNLEHSDTPEIEISNSFSLLGEESGDVQAKKTPKPPPIILYGVDDLAKLTQLIEEVVQTDDYTYKVVSKNQLIISSKTVDKYKTLIEHIRSKGLIGHTFTRKDQKCMRISDNRRLDEGDPVWYRIYNSRDKWLQRRVIERLGRNNYNVSSAEGGVHHRHVDQLKRYTRRSTCVYPGVTEPEDAGSSGVISGPGEAAGAGTALERQRGETSLSHAPAQGESQPADNDAPLEIDSPQISSDRNGQQSRISFPEETPLSRSVVSESQPLTPRLRRPVQKYGFEFD
ncbi:Uncharacterized protein OBRU01_02033 [Operophtera brumata]|uniref:Uncharacterized protein n=1 Tax=Operophtera brumata TaxID=104452 RepID=A0A0L7LT94_OPEBR|nr:Uncharacterized protein OBRU01_02033 [Operophtera brumata]